MIACIVNYAFLPDRIDLAVEFFNSQFWAAIRDKPGFKRGYLLINRETAHGMSVDVWDTTEQAQAGASAIRDQVMPQLMNYLSGEGLPECVVMELYSMVP